MEKLAAILCIITIIFFTSCKKGDIENDQDPATPDSVTIMGFKDSTELIKSIQYDYRDSATNAIVFSMTEYYYYDTLNRKIIISLHPLSSSTQSYNGVEFSYNSKGLLSHVSQKYITQVTDSNSALTSDFTYDEANVINSISLSFINGKHFTISFNKKTLPSGGYQLTWIDPVSYNGYPDSTIDIANFDAKGKMQVYYLGSVLFENIIYVSDSTEYDLNGNIRKIVQTDYTYSAIPAHPDTAITTSVSYDLYDFTSRDTKGDQLYNLDQILNNGLANFPKSLTYNFIPLSNNMNEIAYQYTKYPALITNITTSADNGGGNGGNYSVPFNSSPEYDSENRLIKYRMFYNSGSQNYIDYSISYYK